MAEYRWNKLRKRLAAITADGLKVAFNNSPVRKKTACSEITIRFFQVKLNGETIWRFPKDSAQPIDAGFIYGHYRLESDPFRPFGLIEFPIQSIIQYLDLPKGQLLHYEDKVGLADILKVCDRRIGCQRLKNLELSPAARKIFDVRFKDKSSHERLRTPTAPHGRTPPKD